MKRTPVVIALLLALIFANIAPLPVSAADTTRVWLVHGINGLDTGSPYIQYAVDVWVGGVGCVRSNLTFMGTIGPIVVPAGTQDVRLSPANLAAPCSTAPVLSAPVVFETGKPVTVVFHTNGAGTRTVTKIAMDLTHRSSYNGKSRFTVMNAAYYPPVDLFIQYTPRTRVVGKAADNLSNGQYVVYMNRSGSWKWWFTHQTDAKKTILGPVLLPTRTHYAYFVFLVGSATNGLYTASFSVNTKP